MDDSSGPAPFPDSDELEAETERILRNCIHPEKVKLELETRDKYPNRDGFIELVDDSNRPVGDLTFQLKKIPDSTREPPRYQCKIETLLYTKVISSPFLLLGVDTEKETVYWRLITPSWVESQNLHTQQTKVVNFPEENVLDGETEDYYLEWKEIAQSALESKRIDHEEYRELKEKSNPAIGVNRPEFENIHSFLDEYNSILESEFELISLYRYPNTWKIGYANVEYSDDGVTFGLYPIGWQENDVQIKDIDVNDFKEIHKKSDSVKAVFHAGNPVKNRPKEFARENLEQDLSKIINERGLLHRGDTFLARESIFAFVDEFHELMGLELRDEYSVNDLREGFYTYLQLWIDVFITRFDNLDLNSIARDGYINPRHLQSRIPERVEQEIHEEVQDRIDANEQLSQRYLIGAYNLPAGLFEESIRSLEDDSVQSVVRPYLERDYDLSEGESAKTWDLYSRETVKENLETFANHFPSSYHSVVQHNFPSIHQDLSLFGDATLVVLGFETKEEYSDSDVPPSLHSFYLKNPDESGTRIELFDLDAPEIQRIDDTDFDDVVEIGGVEYEILTKSYGGADFIFKKKPVLNSTYGRLNEALDNYFEFESLMSGADSF